MKAAIIPYQHASGLRALRYLTPDFLIPVAGKPLAEHLVEYFVSAGIRDIHLLVEDDPPGVERYFGTGERWGARIQVLAADENIALPVQLITAFTGIAGPICCVPANLLISGDFAEIEAEASSGSLPIVAGNPGEPALFVVDADILQAAEPSDETADYIRLLDFLRNSQKQPFRSGIRSRLLTTLDEYLAAQRLILDESWPGARISASQRETGIWIDDHVTISPQVKLIAPVLIGHHSRIDGSGTIGPNAVISPFCLINDTDLIEASVLLPGTATGPHTELSHLVVHGSRIVDVRRGVCVTSPDAFILGDLPKSDEKKPMQSGFLPVIFFAALLGLLFWFFFMR
jgi:NDP-sugar pyrophosphorylase family protein